MQMLPMFSENFNRYCDFNPINVCYYATLSRQPH